MKTLTDFVEGILEIEIGSDVETGEILHLQDTMHCETVNEIYKYLNDHRAEIEEGIRKDDLALIRELAEALEETNEGFDSTCYALGDEIYCRLRRLSVKDSSAENQFIGYIFGSIQKRLRRIHRDAEETDPGFRTHDLNDVMNHICIIGAEAEVLKLYAHFLALADRLKISLSPMIPRTIPDLMGHHSGCDVIVQSSDLAGIEVKG